MAGGQCCCYRDGDPNNGKDCWNVDGPERCPSTPWCQYIPGGGDGPCVAARMAEQNLVTPFADRPEIVAATDVLYESMYDVHFLLETSTLGRRVLDYGKTVSEETARIVDDDPELGARVFQTLMKALSFARAMERERIRPGATTPERHFTEEDFAFGAQVAEDVRARTKDPELTAALDDLREQASRFVGLSPREALALFSDEQQSI